MNKGHKHLFLTLAITLFAATAYADAPPDESTDNAGNIKGRVNSEVIDHVTLKNAESNTTFDRFCNTYIKNHVHIGVRSALRTLTDNNSGNRGGTDDTGGTFLGTIYALDEKQNGTPTLLNISYFFNTYIGIELAYDYLAAETVACDTSTSGDKTDGDIVLHGPTITVLARYKNSTKFTPYAGIGIGLYTSSFDADDGWTTSEAYEGAAYNHMAVDNTVGLLLTAGVEWLFTEKWALDLSAQYVQADVDATYTGYYNGVNYTTQTGHFPMDNIALRLGMAYHF